MAVFTPNDIAIQLGVTPEKVREWCRRGHIAPIHRVGRKWVIQPDYKLHIVSKPTKEKRPRGRPAGSKNKKPYPVGIKRPRKKGKALCGISGLSTCASQ